MSKNTEWLSRRVAAVPRGIVSATPVFAARAENAEIWDVDGRRYIDFSSGIGVLATGHRHAKVIAAAHDQLSRFTHTAFQVMAYGPYVELAERLNATAPFQGGAKTLLLSTGVRPWRTPSRSPEPRRAAQASSHSLEPSMDARFWGLP